MTNGTVQLSLSEAVLLGHALVSSVAKRAEVRHLLIKGPSLERYQLREPRLSSDVDALLDPHGFDLVVEELRRHGWADRPKPRVAHIIQAHSTTLIHESWPCDIDLHWRFPGFLADDSTVFNALWERRQTMEFAGIECPVPDKAGSILILALHSLRSSDRVTRHQSELNSLIANSAAQTATERVALADLARETACVETLVGCLVPLGVEAPTPDARANPGLTAWKMQVASGAASTQLWMNALQELPLWSRLRALPSVLWPSESDFKILHPEAGESRSELTAARFKRVARGLRELPRLLVLRGQVARAAREAARDPRNAAAPATEKPIGQEAGAP